MKNEELNKLLTNYDLAGEKIKNVMDREINDAWQVISEKYIELCENDSRYEELHEKVEELNKILNFSVEKEYSDYVVKDDGDAHFEYQEALYYEHKRIAENLEKLIAGFQNEIEKLKNRRFVLNRDKKIREAEKMVEYYNESAEKYNACQERLRIQQEYRDNIDTLVKPYKDAYFTILFNHAYKLVKSSIQKYPIIMCKEHDGVSRGLNTYQRMTLGKVFNEVRKKEIENINYECPIKYKK